MKTNDSNKKNGRTEEENNFCNITHLIYITGKIRAQCEAITNTFS